MRRTFDVALGYWKQRGGTAPTARFGFPADISREMRKEGYNRVSITIVDEGFLVTPYVDDGAPKLPDWKTR